MRGWEDLQKNIATVKNATNEVYDGLKTNLLEGSPGAWNNSMKLMQETQDELGDGLAPMFKEVAQQIRGLAENGEVDFGRLRKAIDNSYQKLKEHNEGLAEMAKTIMNLGVDAMETGTAVSPLWGGIGREPLSLKRKCYGCMGFFYERTR